LLLLFRNPIPQTQAPIGRRRKHSPGFAPWTAGLYGACSTNGVFASSASLRGNTPFIVSRPVLEIIEELLESNDVAVRETRYSRQSCAIDWIALSKGRILCLSLDAQSLDGLPSGLHDELKNRVRIA